MQTSRAHYFHSENEFLSWEDESHHADWTFRSAPALPRTAHGHCRRIAEALPDGSAGERETRSSAAFAALIRPVDGNVL
ncbi:hypothetical protein AvCA_49130 [Azotobacter vinelandii CA]|uniref:Uncharacterized protein n=2 Tax=Azotobacter vinelandii TaxID=354 RepID=C1DKA7_AZOVD|nr:hypothetical protein [Azotobacter vinelandii]ACO81012.1 hypothetical protein Avin_49130 [Azotobacter vinelandii DJ]AGK14206.1 hypothetical protein AvCA_49130 [Azotobacter vinelandii CA]AGK22292.1 hypothetical protein AvCA6_49130 [Azotobacter vinelandii CA6]WKN21793.1 hypothetical protein AVAEIV_004909 [Azotobacter vinelandii]